MPPVISYSAILKKRGDMMINKYDVPLDLNSVNSITAILSYISPGSEILEMGPATGRLTRYLSEEMGCHVSIVEIDPPSFNKAMQYAVDGICADLNKNEWYEYFCGKKFDVIIFSDIIEHLYKPEEVIKKAKSLLKDNGKLLFSIPNIAYSGVISQLINNKFIYTETGLLDDTHIRFFTYYTFHKLMESCGMFIFSEKAIYQDINSGNWPDFESLDHELKRALINREFTDVFQFVFAAVSKSWYEEHKDEMIVERLSSFKGTTAVSTVYYDCGDGFNSQNYLQSTMFIDPNNRFTVAFDLTGLKDLKQLRFDPCDYECKIRLSSINGTMPVNISPINDYVIKDDTVYFFTKDPSFLITGSDILSAATLEIRGEFNKLSNADMAMIIENFEETLCKFIRNLAERLRIY